VLPRTTVVNFVVLGLVVLWRLDASVLLQMLFVEVGGITAVFLFFLEIFGYLRNYLIYLISLLESLSPYDASYQGNCLAFFHIQIKTYIVHWL